MTDKVGVVRNGADLKDALARIYLIEFSQSKCDALANMTATATLIAAAALKREESRGAHFRSDFPQTNPTGERTEMTLAEALDIRARYAKE
jgi:L-aspartate oxidase